MSTSPQESQFIQSIRKRYKDEGPLFWLDKEKQFLAAFDPHIAKQINSDNFADLTIPDKLSDVIRGKKGCPFSWGEIKDGWFKQMHHHTQPECLEQLTQRMTELIEARLNQSIDLVSMAQEVIAQPLIPTILADLPDQQYRRILIDQQIKIKPFTLQNPAPETLREAIHSTISQIRAGSVVRKELRRRQKGTRPRQPDLADPIVDMLPRLGIDRAVDAVTMVLTAIAGPPGATAACLIYELCLKPQHKQTLSDELNNISLQALFENPAKAAPVTQRFVKEVLRKWSSPVVASRVVRTDIEFELNHNPQKLTAGQQYMLSPYLIHHDEKHWLDPDLFDPDRWLPGSARAAKTRGSYIPFGWAPKTCVGQTLGNYQLIILTYLMCTKYTITVNNPDNVSMTLESMPLPLNFSGIIKPV